MAVFSKWIRKERQVKTAALGLSLTLLLTGLCPGAVYAMGTESTESAVVTQAQIPETEETTAAAVSEGASLTAETLTETEAAGTDRSAAETAEADTQTIRETTAETAASDGTAENGSAAASDDTPERNTDPVSDAAGDAAVDRSAPAEDETGDILAQQTLDADEEDEAQAQLLEDFVTRLYRVCLDREPDAKGLAGWVSQLEAGTKTGVQVASGFIFSTEFKNKNYCNACYVEHLYNAFLGRASDSAGKANWTAKLAGGATREEIFNGFAMSTEFFNICARAGILRGQRISLPSGTGTVQTAACAACGTVDLLESSDVDVASVKAFVTRLYQVCLDRTPDESGLNNWVNKLVLGTMTGYEVARGFFFSDEFKNKDYSDDVYLDYLYKGLFDRKADTAGKKGWQQYLDAGASRMQIFRGFIGSTEYQNMCTSYGIDPGSAQVGGSCFHQFDYGTIAGVNISNSGCGPVAFASAMSAYDASIEPVSVCTTTKALLGEGFADYGMTRAGATQLGQYYGYTQVYYAADEHTGKYTEEALAAFRTRIDNGKKTFMILLVVGQSSGAPSNLWTYNGHFIAVVDYRVQKDGTVEYLIRNPNKRDCGWHTAADINLYTNVYYVFSK